MKAIELITNDAIKDFFMTKMSSDIKKQQGLVKSEISELTLNILGITNSPSSTLNKHLKIDAIALTLYA